MPDAVPHQPLSPENQAQQDIERNSGQATGNMSGGQAINISGGTVTIGSGGEATNTQRRPRIEQIPSLLPYLPDRTNQECELAEVIQRSPLQTRQPLICLVHGDERQSHDKFLERLRKVSLPRLLQTNQEPTPVKAYRLQWPASLRQLDKLPARLSLNLASEVERRSLASLEEINQTFCTHPGPVLVHLHLMTDDWDRFGASPMAKILEFWQSWPDLGPDQTLVVCVFIKYQLKRSGSKKRRWFINPIAWLRQFLRCRRCQKLNRAIAEQLESLKSTGFVSYDRLTGTVLSKLENLNRSHVEDWVRDEETKKFAGEAAVEHLLREVREMFDQDETLSMDRVADRLTALLKAIAISGREA